MRSAPRKLLREASTTGSLPVLQEDFAGVSALETADLPSQWDRSTCQCSKVVLLGQHYQCLVPVVFLRSSSFDPRLLCLSYRLPSWRRQHPRHRHLLRRRLHLHRRHHRPLVRLPSRFDPRSRQRPASPQSLEVSRLLLLCFEMFSPHGNCCTAGRFHTGPSCRCATHSAPAFPLSNNFRLLSRRPSRQRCRRALSLSSLQEGVMREGLSARTKFWSATARAARGSIND
jgi:hypothetical protein